MNRYLINGVMIIVAICTSFSSPILKSQEIGESILIQQSVSEDLYLAGENIDVLASVDGDIVAAGRRVIIRGEVTRDVIAAGETVTILGTVEDDLRVVGRTVSLNSEVFGHMVAAGQSILIGADSEIGDWAWLAGELVEITGTVNGDVLVAGRTVVIDGEIHGDVELNGQDIRIGPRGVIHGDLSWRSPNPIDLSELSQIDGETTEKSIPSSWEDDDDNGIGSFFFMILSLTVGSFVLFIIFPNFSKEASNLVRTEPWKCLGMGLALLLITPFVSLILVITAIGYLLGLVLLTAYLCFLIIGLLMGIIAISNFGLQIVNKYEVATKTTWVLAIVITTIVIGLLWKIPFLGGLIFILVWIYGSGCVFFGLIRKYQKPGSLA